MMFNVYSSERGARFTLKMGEFRELAEVRQLAECAAKLGQHVLYRAFLQTPKTASGEHFATAFAISGGVVREHKDVTIPAEHW